MRKNARESGAKAAPARQAERIDVLAELAGLKAMTVPQLQEKWQAIFGERAPNASRGNLELRLGYRIQELAHGGLRRETRRTLDALADEVMSGRLGGLMTDPRKPAPGTKLVREWGSEEHMVTVLADGFEWQGRRFKSLSAAVRAITGAHWNGCSISVSLDSAGNRARSFGGSAGQATGKARKIPTEPELARFARPETRGHSETENAARLRLSGSHPPGKPL